MEQLISSVTLAMLESIAQAPLDGSRWGIAAQVLGANGAVAELVDVVATSFRAFFWDLHVTLQGGLNRALTTSFEPVHAGELSRLASLYTQAFMGTPEVGSEGTFVDSIVDPSSVSALLAWNYLSRMDSYLKHEGSQMRLDPTALEALRWLIDVHFEAALPMVLRVNDVLHNGKPVVETLAPRLSEHAGELRGHNLEELLHSLGRGLTDRDPAIFRFVFGREKVDPIEAAQTGRGLEVLAEAPAQPEKWVPVFEDLAPRPELFQLLLDLQAWGVASKGTGVIDQARAEAASRRRRTGTPGDVLRSRMPAS